MNIATTWFKPLDCWIYLCEDILLEPVAHRLERAECPILLEPKAYAVLVMMVENAGLLIEKNMLLDAVWGHRNVTPGVLSRVISQLRRALGDSAEHPHLIATVYCLGYRFIGEVHRQAIPLDVSADPATRSGTLPVERRQFTDRRRSPERRANWPARTH